MNLGHSVGHEVQHRGSAETLVGGNAAMHSARAAGFVGALVDKVASKLNSGTAYAAAALGACGLIASAANTKAATLSTNMTTKVIPITWDSLTQVEKDIALSKGALAVARIQVGWGTELDAATAKLQVTAAGSNFPSSRSVGTNYKFPDGGGYSVTINKHESFGYFLPVSGSPIDVNEPGKAVTFSSTTKFLRGFGSSEQVVIGGSSTTTPAVGAVTSFSTTLVSPSDPANAGRSLHLMQFNFNPTNCVVASTNGSFTVGFASAYNLGGATALELAGAPLTSVAGYSTTDGRGKQTVAEPDLVPATTIASSTFTVYIERADALSKFESSFPLNTGNYAVPSALVVPPFVACLSQIEKSEEYDAVVLKAVIPLSSEGGIPQVQWKRYNSLGGPSVETIVWDGSRKSVVVVDGNYRDVAVQPVSDGLMSGNIGFFTGEARVVPAAVAKALANIKK